MRAAKKLICLILVALCLAIQVSCEDDSGNTKITPQRVEIKKVFDTYGNLYDYTGMKKSDLDALCDRVYQSLTEYHKLYDIYHEYDGMTNLATLNRTAGEGAQTVDKKIIDLLVFSKEMHEITSGEVNIAMGSVLKIWHDYREAGTKLPPMALLTEAAKHTDINDIVIDEENLTVEILDPSLRIDVGATGKGYAVEMVARALKEEGRSGIVLDVGGNLRVIGKKPSGEGWKSGIRNPQAPYSSTYVYVTELKDAALVTSGGYERFYTVDGVRYHHIINGETLMPENYYLSVSIKSASSAYSDALSTAVFNMTPDEARAFVPRLDGVFAILVFPDGSVETLGVE